MNAVSTALAPAEDYGFFGPDSVTWKVWSYPTSMLLGFSRAVTIEHRRQRVHGARIRRSRRKLTR